MMLSVSLFRDFITVDQHPVDEFSQDVFSFRLPQNFWFDSKVQRVVLYEVFSFVGDVSNLCLKSDGNILPSSLSPDFSKYVLFSSNTSKLSSGVSTIFDRVIERSFVSLEPFFDELDGDNYLYVDFDIDSIGFFCSTGTRKLGGYLGLSLQDFLNNEIEEFFSMPFVCQDSQVMMKLLDMTLLKIRRTLWQNNLEIPNIEKMILGGAYGIYFNSLELKSLGHWRELFNFDIIEKDLNYRIICKNLL